MGAENSVLKQPTRRETDRRTTVQRVMPTSQYYDVKNPKYIESDSQSMTMSSESTTTSEDTDEKKETKEKIEKTQNDSTQYTVSNPLNQFEGLTQAEKIKKSEEMLRRLWKRPHSSWDKITTVTSITTEKTTTDGQVTDEVNREVDHNIDKIIYDVPLDYCHLRVPRNRTTRSCPDPWRRHGAHVKLCEIGGWMPESRNKNARVTPIRKGSIPPPAPRTKPLQNMEDYLKAMKK